MAEDADKITIKVVNMATYPSPATRFVLAFDPDATVGQLYERIIAETSYERDMFTLNKGGAQVTEDDETELATLGMSAGKVTTLMMQKSDAYKNTHFDSKKPISVDSVLNPAVTRHSNNNNNNDDEEDNHRGAETGSMIGLAALPSARSNMYSMGERSSNMSYDWNKKSDTGFVGLSNQGATCYMNSLMQALFMSPEFRAAVYNWSFDDKCMSDWQKLRAKAKANKESGAPVEEKNELLDLVNDTTKSEDDKYNEFRTKKEGLSIPRQLQKLFVQLQLSEQRAVKTKKLTKSFGWSDADAFTQHDVQEMCRVLFDALERAWKGTSQENLINDLYQGEMKDYVRCQECGHESSRADKYLDIPLVIKGFGESKAIKSVEEALFKFVEPEVLSGDNQYSCEKCSKKVNALKGLKFTKFPYVLTLQLKRFDFDYQTMRRIKLNNKVTFPHVLDMNLVLDGYVPRPESDEELLDKELDYKRRVQQEIERALMHGPYVYELYAVLVHRGSALGGHYYAYIKNMDDAQWFDFNDSSVGRIQPNTIEDVFGEEEGNSRYSFFNSGANAYMLMYRQVDRNRNQPHISPDRIPKELKALVLEENSAKKKKQEDKQLEKQMITLKVHYKGQVEMLRLHKDTTIEDATHKVVALYESLKEVPLDRIRMRDYQVYYDTPGAPYAGKEKRTLDQCHMFNTKHVMLEVLPEGETEWPAYDPRAMAVKVVCYLSESDSWSDALDLFIDREGTLKYLKQHLTQVKGLPYYLNEKQMCLVREDYGKQPGIVLHGEDRDLRWELRVNEGTKLYLEPLPEDVPDVESTTWTPKAFAEIERTKNLIELKVKLPNKEIHKLKINRTITLGELKQQIIPLVQLTVDEFKVLKGSKVYRTELRNERETLRECNLVDGMKIVIEKGKPLRRGETMIKFMWFRPDKASDGELLEELFDAPIPEDMLVRDVKLEVSHKLKQDKNIELAPEHIRLREMFHRSPSTIFMDDQSLKEAARVLRPDQIVAVQQIAGPETKQKHQTVVFVRQWHPDRFELGPYEELSVVEDDKVDVFKQQLAEHAHIDDPNEVAIVRTFPWSGPSLLDVSDLDWDSYKKYMYHDGTLKSLRLSDGDLVIFKDARVALKELSKEEAAQLKRDEAKKRASSSGVSSRRERDLKIKTHEDEDKN
jgi:ubiquitin C-terminal hydrolase